MLFAHSHWINGQTRGPGASREVGNLVKVDEPVSIFCTSASKSALLPGDRNKNSTVAKHTRSKSNGQGVARHAGAPQLGQKTEENKKNGALVATGCKVSIRDNEQFSSRNATALTMKGGITECFAVGWSSGWPKNLPAPALDKN
jgi:hypothetical protein